MKKLLLTTALALAAQSAQAESINFKPYIGLDLQRFAVDYQDGGDAYYEDNLDGFNVHAGARLNKYFGVEAGIFKTREESKGVDGALIGAGIPDFSTDIDMWGITLDGLGYLPLDPKFDLIGTAGISWINADASASVAGTTISVDEQEIGFRIGAGGQFNINEQWNIRGLARYQTADFDDTADDAMVYTLGVNYSF